MNVRNGNTACAGAHAALWTLHPLRLLEGKEFDACGGVGLLRHIDCCLQTINKLTVRLCRSREARRRSAGARVCRGPGLAQLGAPQAQQVRTLREDLECQQLQFGVYALQCCAWCTATDIFSCGISIDLCTRLASYVSRRVQGTAREGGGARLLDLLLVSWLWNRFCPHHRGEDGTVTRIG